LTSYLVEKAEGDGDGDGDDEVVVIEEHAPRPSAAEADDIGAEGLKRS
jgi:hypothetical protein